MSFKILWQLLNKYTQSTCAFFFLFFLTWRFSFSLAFQSFMSQAIELAVAFALISSINSFYLSSLKDAAWPFVKRLRPVLSFTWWKRFPCLLCSSEEASWNFSAIRPSTYDKKKQSNIKMLTRKQDETVCNDQCSEKNKAFHIVWVVAFRCLAFFLFCYF